MKNYHLDLVRVTEGAALAASEWVGRGDKEEADRVATEAMRDRLNRMDFCAQVAIGEGKKDKSHGLYEGEKVGRHFYGQTKEFEDKSKFERVEYSDADFDLAIDPIEGTTPTAKGGPEAMSVIAMADHGSFFKTEHFYMKKMAVGPGVADSSYLDIRDGVVKNARRVMGRLDKSTVTVCMLDRPRHQCYIDELRSFGCRIKLISDCDVMACLATCFEECGVDLYFGIGGSPEGVIAAAALKCLRGRMQAQLVDEKFELIDDRVYETGDLAQGDVMFSATGITDGTLLKGVQYKSRGKITHSLAMRSESGTIRRITTEHGN